MDVKPTFDYQPERPGEIGNFVADSEKLEKIFSKIPSTSLNHGLMQTISWIKENTS